MLNSDNLENNSRILEDVISNKRLSHALLFEVDDYDQSMVMIKNLVKLMLCNEKKDSVNKINCGLCNICNLIDENNYPDLIIIEADGNWIKKQQLKDLQSDLKNKSLLGDKRIYIIKGAEKLNISSSNSLLKFLEEPEDNIFAILLTKNRYLLLDTILSRCQIYNLKKDKFDINNFANENAEKFIEYIARKRNLFIDYKELSENIFCDKVTIKEILSSVEKYFLYYLLNYKNSDLFDEYLYKMLQKISIDDMSNYVQIIETEIQKLEFNVNLKIWIDLLFSRFIGEVYG